MWCLIEGILIQQQVVEWRRKVLLWGGGRQSVANPYGGRQAHFAETASETIVTVASSNDHGGRSGESETVRK